MINWFLKMLPHQILDEHLQLLLSLLDCLLRSHNSNQLLVFVLWSREDDPGSCVVTHLANVSTSFANQELVILWLSTQVYGITFGLLQEKNKQKSIYAILWDFSKFCLLNLWKRQAHTLPSCKCLFAKANYKRERLWELKFKINHPKLHFRTFMPRYLLLH